VTVCPKFAAMSLHSLKGSSSLCRRRTYAQSLRRPVTETWKELMHPLMHHLRHTCNNDCVAHPQLHGGPLLEDMLPVLVLRLSGRLGSFGSAGSSQQLADIPMPASLIILMLSWPAAGLIPAMQATTSSQGISVCLGVSCHTNIHKGHKAVHYWCMHENLPGPRMHSDGRLESVPPCPQTSAILVRFSCALRHPVEPS